MRKIEYQPGSIAKMTLAYDDLGWDMQRKQLFFGMHRGSGNFNVKTLHTVAGGGG